MKKLRRPIVALGVVFAMLFGASAAYASHEFPDVPDSHPFHDDIDFLAERSITGGFGDGTYRPNDNVTRGQMARFMTRLADALTPELYASAGFHSATDPGFLPQGACQTTSFTTPDYETQASATAIYSVDMTGQGATPNVVWAYVEASTNGTDFFTIGGSGPEMELEDGLEQAAGATAVTSLTPNTTYTFRIGIRNAGFSYNGYCDLTVTVHHQMPSGAGPASVPPPTK